MGDVDRPPAEDLGRWVRWLQETAGLTVTEQGRQAAVSQPIVSRVERGVVLLILDLLNRFAEVLGLEAEQQAEFVGLYSRAAQDTAGRRGRGRGVVIIDGMAVRERSAGVVRSFQTLMIPALLQTEEYAAAVGITPWLSVKEAASVAARHTQRRAVLDKLGADFRFVLTEGALASRPPLSASSPPGRRRRVAWLSLGIVPRGPRVRTPPLYGFTFYDDTAVSVETFTANC